MKSLMMNVLAVVQLRARNIRHETAGNRQPAAPEDGVVYRAPLANLMAHHVV